MPDKFENRITELTGTSLNDFKAEIRTSAGSMEECLEWMSQFEKSSKITWKVNSTAPHLMTKPARHRTRKLQFKKTFCCKHSNKGISNPGSARNDQATGCQANLKILVKVDTKWSRKNDKYVALGNHYILVC